MSGLAGPVVVLGAGGMLGRAFRETLEARNVPFLTVPRAELDFERPQSVDSGLPDEVGTVINCAGWTDVDGAEQHRARADRVNGEAVAALADACARRRALLVHFSTDYVFDGCSTEPYRVDTERAPLNAYGHGKALGERALEQGSADYLLLRTSWVYAPWGKNFVLTMLELARKRESLRVVEDQVGRPSSAEGVARTALALLESGARGTFHVTDAGQCSWFELARECIEAAGLTCEVEPCTSDEYPRPARRPAFSVLDLGATEKIVGPLDHWRPAVQRVVRRVVGKD